MTLAPPAGQRIRNISETIANAFSLAIGKYSNSGAQIGRESAKGSFMIPVSCAESFDRFFHVRPGTSAAYLPCHGILD
jgi:hypothetical protein